MTDKEIMQKTLAVHTTVLEKLKKQSDEQRERIIELTNIVNVLTKG